MTVAVSPELVEELRARVENDSTPSGLEELTSQPLVLGFVIASARAEGHDECDQVEILVRAARFEKRYLRECEVVLRRLGYTAVADRLRQLARLRRCQ